MMVYVGFRYGKLCGVWADYDLARESVDVTQFDCEILACWVQK